MTLKQKAIRTTMYSVETIQARDGTERQEVVTHQLPWEKGSEKLAQLKVRGFTFEKPVGAEPTAQDKRVAALEKARAAKAAKKGA